MELYIRIRYFDTSTLPLVVDKTLVVYLNSINFACFLISTSLLILSNLVQLRTIYSSHYHPLNHSAGSWVDDFPFSE